MRTFPSLVVLGAVACASGPQLRGSARPPPRFVLVNAGVSVRARPDDASTAVALPQGSVFRRVGTVGEWVELETVRAPMEQCAPALAGPAGMLLRFFVRGADLAQVLARPVNISTAEGVLTIQPGVVVAEASSGGTSVEVVHDGLRVGLVLVPALGRDHRAPRVTRNIPRAERLAPETRVRLPDGAFAEVSRDVNVYVARRRAVGDGARVAVQTRCVYLEGVAPARAVLPVLELEFEHDGETDRQTDEEIGGALTLRRGARLRWRDGTPAGRAVSAVGIASAGRAEGGVRCFEAPMRLVGGTGETPTAPVEVCANARDLR